DILGDLARFVAAHHAPGQVVHAGDVCPVQALEGAPVPSGRAGYVLRLAVALAERRIFARRGHSGARVLHSLFLDTAPTRKVGIGSASASDPGRRQSRYLLI